MSESFDLRVGVSGFPGMACETRTRRSPETDHVREMHLAWADAFGVYDSEKIRRIFVAVDIGDLASRMYPDGRASDIALMADWSAWLLLRDDRWDVTESLAEWERLAERDRQYLALMRRGHRSERGIPAGEAWEDTLYPALSDLCERTRRRAAEGGVGEPVNGRFISMMGDFFRGSVRQAFLQRRGELPPLSEYLELRRVTGGLDILTHVRAATDGVSIAGEALSSGAVARLHLAADNICCWHNDLVSLRKELAGGEIHNLAIVLARDPSVPCRDVSEGFAMVAQMIRDEQREFESLKETLLARGGPKAAVTEWYVGMLEERIDGIISWQELCARYGGSA